MFKQDSPFFQRSKKVTEEFLKTVVLVDDLASFEDTPASEPIAQGVVSPARPRSKARGEPKSVDQPNSGSRSEKIGNRSLPPKSTL